MSYINCIIFNIYTHYISDTHYTSHIYRFIKEIQLIPIECLILGLSESMPPPPTDPLLHPTPLLYTPYTPLLHPHPLHL